MTLMVKNFSESPAALEPSQLPEELIVDEVETLKILADPLRLRILELLVKARTVKQIAARLGLPPTKLYYHINLLENHNLIRVVDTRLVSGVLEKQYQIVARAFRIPKGLLAPGSDAYDESVDSTLTSVLDTTIADIKRSARAGLIDETSDAPESSSLNMYRYRFHLTEEEAEDFHQRLHALLDEFNAHSRSSEADESARSYRLLYVMYPADGSAIETDDSD